MQTEKNAAAIAATDMSAKATLTRTLEVTMQWNQTTEMWMAFVGCEGLGHTTGILDCDPAIAARRSLDAFIKRMHNDFGDLPGAGPRWPDPMRDSAEAR